MANVPKKDIARLTNFAKTLGIYIQLVNDYEDYFKKQQGDYLLGDFSSGKLTYPLIAAQNITTATH
ncbi:MAG: polyprenyl synthetase family protein [Candidatus Saccharibacteria bacterium]